MDGDAVDLGEVFLDAVFNSGGDVVDLRDGKIPVHGAVAGDEDFVFNGTDVSFVAVGELMKFGGKAIDEIADADGKFFHFLAASDMRAERLDVDDDGSVAVGLAEQVVLKFGGEAMSIAKGGAFVDFEMKLDEKAAIDLMRG